MADAVYIEPINWQTVEKIIAKEKPDALLPTMGGQTALNCRAGPADNGVLEKYNVELIGAKREAIRMAEDRELFRVAMGEIGLECPTAAVAHPGRSAGDPDPRRLPDHHPPQLHPGRQRRRHRLQPRRAGRDRQPRPGTVADHQC
jgi:carbamoyl-phosphate synthase large subunit